MRIVTFYGSNINEEFPKLQQKVFKKFGFKIEQHLCEPWVKHGKHVDDFLNTIEDENEIVVLFDIDCIPLNSDIIPKAVKWASENIGIYSMAQTAGWLGFPIIHAAPAFMVFSIKTYNKLGRPSFLETGRSDCGAELTWSARDKGIDIFLMYPTHAENPHTLVENGRGRIKFGHGTTYNNVIYHAFESRYTRRDSNFLNKCRQILNED